MWHRVLVGIVFVGLLVGGWVLAGVQTSPGAEAAGGAGGEPLGAGDTIHVSVYELAGSGKNYVIDVVVNEMGDIRIRNLGAVHVQGLTPAEVEEKIGAAAVAGRLLPARSGSNPGPQVSVKVAQRAAEDAAAFRNVDAGDTLRVNVFEFVTPGLEYVIDARVNELGDIKLMNIGTVHVAGLSPTQVEEKLARLAVEGKLLAPKGATNPGPQVFIRILKKAEAGAVAGVLPKIGPKDTLEVRVHELAEPGQEYAAELQVDEAGNIKLRVLGEMPAAGMTATELEEKIAEKAVREGFLMAKGPGNPGPQVIVTLLKKAAPGGRP